jgi:hypothetical protein
MSKMVIPGAALEQHTIVLGKTRAGKSSKMRYLVEHLLEGGIPTIVIDPKGDWWGIKSSADGKTPGYPVVIFGGEHADVPINEHSGAAVAELVATSNRPCVIDLGGWMVRPRTRFFIDFASTLFKLTKGRRCLVIDEVHNFAPQGKVMDPEAGKMLHWANRLASEGAGKGLILLSASQRPQKVHKDFVTSNETLIACRVIHNLDRGAIKEWIDGCADPAIGKEVLTGLAQLQRPQAYVWSPEIGFGPKLVEFPLFSTYDSFKPQDHRTGSLKGWASVDLADVKDKLAKVVEEAKANDPKELKAKVASLEKALAEKNAVKTVDEGTVTDAHNSGYETGYLKGHEDGFKLAANAMVKNAADVIAAVRIVPPEYVVPNAIPQMTSGARKKLVPQSTESQVPVSTQAAASRFHLSQARATKVDGISAPMQRILNSVGFWNSVGTPQPSRAQVAVVAGYSPSSGGFNNLVGKLNTEGLLRIPGAGRVELTENAPCEIMGGSDAVSKLRSVLSAPQQKLVDSMGSEAMTREQLASLTGYSAASGGFNNLIGSLCTLTVFTKPAAGFVELSDWAKEVLL